MKSDQSLARTVPIVAIRGSVVFPHTDTILSFGRSKSVSAVNAAFQDDRVIAIFTQKDLNTDDPKVQDLNGIVTIATITQIMSTEGEIHAMIKGQMKARIEEYLAQNPC